MRCWRLLLHVELSEHLGVARRVTGIGVPPTMPRSCASPDPIRSPITTNPVAMPTRVCSGALDFNPPTAWINSSPARTALGIVLMRLRIAKVHEHPVAHILRYEPAEALHSLRDARQRAGEGRPCARADGRSGAHPSVPKDQRQRPPGAERGPGLPREVKN
jgi:hypothetical protein